MTQPVGLVRAPHTNFKVELCLTASKFIHAGTVTSTCSLHTHTSWSAPHKKIVSNLIPTYTYVIHIHNHGSVRAIRSLPIECMYQFYVNMTIGVRAYTYSNTILQCRAPPFPQPQDSIPTYIHIAPCTARQDSYIH